MKVLKIQFGRKVNIVVFCLLATFYIFHSINAHATPQGGSIVGGVGTIKQNNLTTTINQATELLSVNWSSFDINQNELVNFIQPGLSSIALNRILGNNASQVFGQLNANGHVILNIAPQWKNLALQKLHKP